ncbi:MAG: hypothetical protein ACYSVY_21170 [Planctomycetota bacterium]
MFLHVERGFSGRQVQPVHVILGKRKHTWRQFVLPYDRGAVTACDAMAAPAGAERDRAIDAWCTSVWQIFGESHGRVIWTLQHHGIV